MNGSWVDRYGDSHHHPVNRACHLIGIPLIVISLVMIIPAIWQPGLWSIALALFIAGWALQFIGHAFEGKPPEFLKDWRFLLVGMRWWLMEVRELFGKR